MTEAQLQSKINMKLYVAYWMAQKAMALSNLGGQLSCVKAF